jgi:hypothetical protein
MSKQFDFELLIPLDTSLYRIIHDLIEKNLTKAASIPVTTEEIVWFLTRTVHISDTRCCKKYMVQTLVNGMEGDTVHVPLSKHKNYLHATCSNKLTKTDRLYSFELSQALDKVSHAFYWTSPISLNGVLPILSG